MGEICLSVAPILRCQSLTGLEAGILLLPPGLEVIFACVLLWIKRGSADKKHVFLALEMYTYFFLSLLDLFAHRIPSLGASLDHFRTLDIFIGVTSVFPLFLYTLSLYLLTSSELVPALPVRFQKIAKYVLAAFIPLILILNEVASFVSIRYLSAGGQNGVPLILHAGFTDTTSQTFLSSVTLVLLTAFQALNFCIAFFRLVKAFSHQRTLETTDKEKKEMEAHLFRGLGWIVAGLKLGALETVIGFAQGGFGVAFTRKLLRLLGHACLVIGIVKGVDTVEDFQLYSPSQAQKRRKSALRAMIQNPRFSTFRHVGGHDFDAENAVAPKRDSVIKLGDPSWMRRDVKHALNDIQEEDRVTPGLTSARKSSSLTFKLAARSFSIRTGSRKSRTSTVRDSTSSFGSSKRNSWPPAGGAIAEDEADYADEATDVVATEFERVPRPAPAFPRPVRERVTVYMRQDRLPVLQLRRLSNLEFLDLVTDPFRDPHGRARSLPGNFDDVEPQAQAFSHVSASFTRLPAYAGAHTNAQAPAVPPMPIRAASVRESVASRHSRSMSATELDRPASVMSEATARPPSVATYNPRDSGVSFQHSVRYSMASYAPRDSMASYVPRNSMMSYHPPDSALTYSRPPSTMSFHAIGTPGSATSFELPPSVASPNFGGLSRRDRGLSSSTTASQVHALAEQFPVIPMRPVAVPRPRSMLSHEVPRTEFVVEEDVPMPPNAASVARVPSARRKPVPVPEEVEAPSEPSTPKPQYQDLLEKAQVQRTITEQEATGSLPTPLSPPHTTARWPAKRARSLTETRRRRAPPPPLELAAATVVDVQATQAEDYAFSPAAAQSAQLMRVKSVGSAPQRTVSASRRTAFARESVQAEFGHVIAKGRSIAGPVDGPKRARMAEEEAVDVVRYSVFNEA